MKAKVIKKLGITFAIAAFLGAGMVYQGLIPLSFAAEDEHGHPHGHEDGEESHGEGRDEHGHAHEAKPEQNHGEGEDEHGHGEEGHDEGALKLSPEQMSASGVKTVIVRQGSLSHQVSVPGRIVADADRMAQIVPKVSGVVVEARKNLGDTVG